MSSTTDAQLNNLPSKKSNGLTVFSTIGNDPLAYLLIKLRLLGPGPFRKWLWPIIVTFFYFLVNDCLLPLLLHRFSSHAGYIGPFDPLRLPNLIVDAIFVPALVYYYGQTTLILPNIFERLVENGIFGSPQDKEVISIVERQRRIFLKYMGSIWLTPLAIALALWITLTISMDYASPPHPHMYINLDSHVFLFNVGLWLLNYYMLTMIFMHFILLAVWLLRLHGKSSQWPLWLRADVLHPDNRMGFKPITECAVLAAKMIVVLLLSLVLILKGNENIGLSPSSPSWLSYIFILILSGPVVIPPLYIVHRFMKYEKDRFIQKITAQMGFLHTQVFQSWSQFSQDQQLNILMAQILLLRLAQLPDWPVTISEMLTVFVTYLLGTFLALLSVIQNIVSFIR